VVSLGVAVGTAIGPVLAQMASRVFQDDPVPLNAPGGLAGAWRSGVVAAESGMRRRALLITAVSSVLLGATAAVIGPAWVLPAYLWFTATTWLLTLTDIDRKLIPNRILYPATVIGAILLAAGGLLDGQAGALGRAALGALAYFGVLFVLALIAGGGFGFGDVKLGFFLGMYLAYQSWGTLVVGSVGAFLLGGLLGLLLVIFRIRSRKDKIPFGPYLVAGAYLALAFGPEIVDWYFS
jgi:leader peptidase (prepilin peptidase)/N-methyltransferase